MKAISKIVAILAVSALAFGMFGCGGDDKSKKASTNPDEATTYTAEDVNAQDITVEKSGYSLTQTSTINADGNEVMVPSVNFAFVAKNPNAGYVAQNVPFNVTGYNAAGETVFSGGTTCMYMYPGIDTAMSGTAALTAAEGVDTNISSFVVTPLLSTVDYLKTDLTDSQLNNMFTVSNEEVTPDGNGISIDACITGDLADGNMIFKVANLDDTLEGHAVVIFTNEAGEIVYGSESTNVLIDQTTLDTASGSDGSSPISNFSVSLPNVPTYANYTIYVMPGL